MIIEFNCPDMWSVRYLIDPLNHFAYSIDLRHLSTYLQQRLSGSCIYRGNSRLNEFVQFRVRDRNLIRVRRNMNDVYCFVDCHNPHMIRLVLVTKNVIQTTQRLNFCFVDRDGQFKATLCTLRLFGSIGGGASIRPTAIDHLILSAQLLLYYQTRWSYRIRASMSIEIHSV